MISLLTTRSLPLTVGALTLALCLSTGLAPSAAIAQVPVTPAELLARGDLQARVTIDTQGALYQRAPFQLAVEIATPRWFSRGTRVRDFRIPGAVIKPVSSFADNMSQRIAGQTWSQQRWRFRVFPREDGELAIPSLTVFVSVNTETDGVVEGELTLDAPVPTILTPPGVLARGDWVATPSLTVEERWEGLLDSYVPGDALTRVRTFVMRDAPAMMLPGSDITTIDGLSLYNAPAVVTDESERGSLVGTREETLVITFEAPGEYLLPGLEYDWFNTGTQELERISLAPRNIVVGAAADAPISDNNASSERFDWTADPRLLVATALAVVCAVLLSFLWRTAVVQRQRTWIAHTVGTWRDDRRSYRHYQQALREGNSRRCVTLLYQHLNAVGEANTLRQAISQSTPHHGNPGAEKHQPDVLNALEELLQHAYGSGKTLPATDLAARIWNALGNKQTMIGSALDAFRSAPKLQLNPSRAPE